MTNQFIADLAEEIEALAEHRIHGSVSGIQGLLVSCEGLQGILGIGGRCRIAGRGGRQVTCEAVGLRDRSVLLMPFGPLDGVTLGSRVDVLQGEASVRPGPRWLGRVINALAEPIDGKGPLGSGHSHIGYAIRRRRRMVVAASAARSTWECARSTPSSPVAAASAWAYSPPPGSASPSCCR